MSIPIESILANRDHLGEGPLWDRESSTLTWVDIERGLRHRLDPLTEDFTSEDLGAPLIFAIPSRSGGVVIAHQHTVELIAASGERSTLATIDATNPDMSLQDARCDAGGRLVFGQLAKSRSLGTSRLFSLDPSGDLRVLKTNVSMANGLDWNADGDQFFHIDSDMQNIEVYDYDQSTGDISNGRVFASIPMWEGLPDGMCVDTDGGVWVALFGGREVRRYDERGLISERIEMPTTNVTSVAFGGRDLDTLFVTSASLWLPDGATEDLAGALFGCRPGATGTYSHLFGA